MCAQEREVKIMKNSNYWQKLGIFLLATIFVAGCGGGGGGGSGPVGGIDRLGVSAGTVTGFGSIRLSDDVFDVNEAEFDVNDDSTGSSQDDLSVGDFVVVIFDTGAPNTALSVISDEAVEGPISSINEAAGVVIVAGQTVFVDANTSFDDSIATSSLAGLQINNFIEVSGFIDADGSIRATRIEFGQGEAEVHGIVSGKNATTFMINALTIEYGPEDIDDDFPGGTFDNGDLVEVKGTINVSGVLVATKVEPDGFGVGEGGADNIGDFEDFDDAEIEGFITRFASSSDFDVAGIPVITNGGTTFVGGAAGDLGVNVKVEVDGSFNSSGILVASEVDIRRTNDLRVTALVNEDESIAGTNRLTVLGVDIRIDTQTRLEDKSDADLEPFNLSDIDVGDYVEIRGAVDPGGADILALILEREDIPDVPGEDTELRAFVDVVDEGGNSLTVAGVTVNTLGAQFRDINDQPISAATFFATVQEGDLVDADGTETGLASMNADEISLESL